MDWHLECSACGATAAPDGLPTVCACGQPWLVRYPDRRPDPQRRSSLAGQPGMWRIRDFLPLVPGEDPVTLGEGDTPLLAVPRIGTRIGLPRSLVKDESVNPTGSFKARGLAAAVTRAVAGGAPRQRSGGRGAALGCTRLESRNWRLARQSAFFGLKRPGLT